MKGIESEEKYAFLGGILCSGQCQAVRLFLSPTRQYNESRVEIEDLQENCLVRCSRGSTMNRLKNAKAFFPSAGCFP
jgi:hypothetical protein